SLLHARSRALCRHRRAVLPVCRPYPGGGYSACGGRLTLKIRKEDPPMNVTATRPQAADCGIVVAGRPMPVFRKIDVEPLTGAAGCEIKGVDLTKPLAEGVLAEIMLAFEHFLVIMLRNQNLTPEQHKAFTRHFGEFIELPQAPTYGDHHDMQEVRREAHEPVSVVPFTRFHTDSPFLAQPPLCMVMRALEVPKYGG